MPRPNYKVEPRTLRFRHYQGTVYQILGYMQHESDGKLLVVYAPVVAGAVHTGDNDSTIYRQHAERFFGMEENDQGDLVPRFQLSFERQTV